MYCIQRSGEGKAKRADVADNCDEYDVEKCSSDNQSGNDVEYSDLNGDNEIPKQKQMSTNLYQMCFILSTKLIVT